MSEISVLVNLVLILAAAAAGGALALRLRQPVILGYLIAGLVIGPFTPGPIADFDQLRLLIEVGLALLLFVLGAGMSPSRFRGLGNVILLGGSIQIVLTVGLGILFMPLFGLNLAQGFLIGIILAQSSSAVIARVLDDRNESESMHGRIAVGMSAIQDVSSLPLLLLLAVFLGESDGTLLSFLIALGQVVALAIAAYILGRLLWPRLLEWIGHFGSEELTLLVALALALGGGVIVQMIGLSFAFGAFLAGLVIAESSQRPAAISRVLPMRDVFAAVFFVSMGALFDPSVFWESPIALIGFLGALVIGKLAVTAFAVRLFTRTPIALLAGLLLAQIGEFAFILVNIGLDQGIISQRLFSVIISAAVISISINSLLLDSAPPVLTVLARITRFYPLMKQPVRSVTFALRNRTPSSERRSRPR
ncbi:MAG: cation:proton antiporter [Chloroflexi bacterium]|nr:cation:proton antiporter [Chloroflexota bacterium]